MVNENDIISIIVPVYNIEQYLEKCVKSILKQTYTKIQVILVDDGSTDRSGEICDYYQERDVRVRVIHKQNGGLVSARKAGLEIAEGEYIGFVDGDDYIDSVMYEELLQTIKKEDCDFVHSGYIEEGICIKRIVDFEEKVYYVDEETRTQLCMNFFNQQLQKTITPSIWSKLFKSDFIKMCYSKVPDEQSLGEDVISLYACLKECERVVFRRVALYHYNVRSESLSHKSDIESIVKLGGLYKNLNNLAEMFHETESVRECIKKYYLRCVIGNMDKMKDYNMHINLFSVPDMSCLYGKKIVIYGAGKVGQDYYNQISRYKTCEIVAWVDGKPENYTFDYCEIMDKEIIKSLEWDIVLIAVNNVDMVSEIRQTIQQMGISSEKIMWLEPKVL